LLFGTDHNDKVPFDCKDNSVEFIGVTSLPSTANACFFPDGQYYAHPTIIQITTNCMWLQILWSSTPFSLLTGFSNDSQSSFSALIDMVRPSNQVELTTDLWQVHPAVKLETSLANDAAG
jgi:hypothetical protein